MAKKFIIKANKGKPSDPFFMQEGSSHLYFSCTSIRDLRGTLRCILAPGYRVPKPPALSRRIKQQSGHLIGCSPFFGTTMFEVFEVPEPGPVSRALDYTNRDGFTWNLKAMEPGHAEQIINSKKKTDK